MDAVASLIITWKLKSYKGKRGKLLRKCTNVCKVTLSHGKPTSSRRTCEHQRRRPPIRKLYTSDTDGQQAHIGRHLPVNTCLSKQVANVRLQVPKSGTGDSSRGQVSK